ncbi:MAG: hypothetical protein IJ679_10005 [Lachnospiraceae bacterium]|nr:hypothetical protein [Lachnospiraceae bacterium]
MNTNRLYLNDNWIFFKKWSDALTGASDKSGIQVRLPHAIREIPLHYFNDNAGEALCGYQQWLSIPRDWEGQSLLLTFEGVAYHYKVFVNGLQVADEKLGFTKITIDITDAVSFGSDNLISVRVDSRRSSVLPYLGEEWNELLMGGIYRDVYLDI